MRVFTSTVVVVLSLAAVSSAAAQHTSRSAARRAAPAPRLVQIGLASFYGAGFQGDRTASGERFDQRQLVAAHRNLPLGSVVRVTNLENGRSIVVRVIDRGPYGRNHRKGCIIDLSKAAARQLGFVGDGVTRVKVRVLHLASDHKEH